MWSKKRYKNYEENRKLRRETLKFKLLKLKQTTNKIDFHTDLIKIKDNKIINVK